MRWNWVAALLLVFVLGISGQTAAWGQAQNSGSIYGQVNDPSGAIIPGATVTATDAEKGITRTVKSNGKGEFNFSSLPVGTYALTVETPGFETYVASSITVDADKAVKIEAKMTVGKTTDTVQVDAEGTALDTRSATIGTLIDNKLVEDLPIDGRNVVALAGLLPGVTDLNAPPTNTSDRGGPTYSVSGSRNTQNLMLFDGLMWNNLFFNTGINYPPPNSLQEISVLLNNFKAQYGRNAGSVFNVVTKSGTNQIHGSVWEYLQNQMFNASDYITGKNPKDISNQFGFAVQGPIIKDKLFYAVAFQDLIQHLQVIGETGVPTTEERGFLPDGKTLRPCTNASGIGYPAGTTCANFTVDTQGGKLLNPATNSSTSGLGIGPSDAEPMFDSASAQAGGPASSPCWPLLLQANVYQQNLNITNNYLPYQEVPTACLNPVIAAVNAAYVPLPNHIATNGRPDNISVAPQPRNDRNGLVRLDWVASTHHTVDARYDIINANDATAPGVNSSGVGIATFEVNANSAVSNFGNIGDTWVLTPNVVNVLRAGYKRYTVANPPTDNRTWNSFGGNFYEPGVPVMPSISISNAFTLGNTSQANASVVNENIEILEQLSWVHGAHNFQFGANFIRAQYLNVTDYPGRLAFSTGFTGVGIADYELGLLNSVQANSELVQGGIQHSIFGYAQDDWRATPKLTLNLGVRYELPFQWYQPNGYSSTFIPGHQSTVFPGAIGGLAYPGDPGVLNSLVPTDYNGLVPRFGFAYDTFGNGKLALRGGFGMFFDAINANVIGVGEPFYFQFFRNIPKGGASVPLAQLGNNPNDQRPNGNVLVLPNGFNRQNPQFAAPYSLFYPDRNFRTPYYEAFNIGFEARVSRGGVLDVNYVGKLGRKLTIPFDQNPAITDCTGGYYKANPTLYGNPSCTYLYGTPEGGATSSQTSTQARLRYTPFNSGGGGLVDFASIGTSNYNGLQLQFTQRGGRLLTILGSYTYSKSIDLQTASQTTSNSIPNVFDISSERGVSDYDARHILNMGWTLNFPVIRTGSALTRSVLNGWIYSGTFNAHTGRPFSIRINNDTALDGEPNQRAALRPGMSPYLPSNRHRKDKINQYFNTAAFTYPVLGTFSPLQRNSMYGPGYLMTNMTLGRSFPLHFREGMRLLFRAEAFNVFNTPNLANPASTFSCSSTSIQDPNNVNFGRACTDYGVSTGGAISTTVIGSTSTTFGIIPSTYGNNGNVSTNGRKMQFSATVYF